MIYHVTPITPHRVLKSLAGRAMMVRWQRRDQLKHVLRLAPYVRFENGAYGLFRKEVAADWPDYYAWIEPMLFHPGRDAIIPDVIGAGGQYQDALLAEWPFGHKGLPVWHTDEPIDRLLRLIDAWPKVCIGSTGEHWQIWLPGRPGTGINPVWYERMGEVWDVLGRRRELPHIHMLRGTGVMHLFPFADGDSSSVGQNNHRHRKNDRAMPLFPGQCGVVDYADKLERVR